jgi:hypothetical protein
MKEVAPAAAAAGQYSNKHVATGGVLANAADADSATKIAGEGARWKIIADNAGTIRDATKF